jgi:YVTN family beta-propeller protein
MVATAGAIFVAANAAGPEPTGAVVRIDPSTNQVTTSLTTGRWVHSLAADGALIWATNFRDGTLSVIDAQRPEVVATTPIGNRPGGVAIGDGSLWVTPHRRNSLLRLDPSVNLEAAAAPDVARTIDVESGTVYLRCSGDGSPTAIIPGNTGEGPAWAVVEARLSRTTRVCAYEPVGIADPAEIGRAAPHHRSPPTSLRCSPSPASPARSSSSANGWAGWRRRCSQPSTATSWPAWCWCTA